MRNQTTHYLVASVLVFATAVTPTVVVAQTAEPEQSADETAANDKGYDDYFMSAHHRTQIYEDSRKEYGRAILYTALFPGLGNIYAEQYLIAGIEFILMAFSATFVGYGLATKQYRIAGIGGATMLVAYGGGMATSAYGVSRFNEQLRRGLKVDEARVGEAWTPTLVMRF